MKNGWYEIPDFEYHDMEGYSSSEIKTVLRSPAHYLASTTAEKTDSKALSDGRAVHMAVLEPYRFTEKYVVSQTCSALKNDGKPCDKPGRIFDGAAWHCGVHGKNVVPVPVEVLAPDVAELCAGVYASLTDRGEDLFCDEGECEMSGFFTDPETGLLCKCRPDWMRRGLMMRDLKTTLDARPHAFERDILKYKYHVSAAYYLDIANALGANIDRFQWVAVEKNAPYAIVVHEASESTILRGRQEYRKALTAIAEAKDAGVWPGYPTDVNVVDLPMLED